MRTLLLAILAILIMVEFVWQQIGQFHVDIVRYGAIILLMSAFMAGAAFYTRIRNDQSIASMLFGLGFSFAAAASLNVINYFGLTVAGPRIDNLLARLDRSLGLDWPALMQFAANHPAFNFVLFIAYGLSVWQIAVLIICLGWSDRVYTVERLCLAIIVSGLMTVGIWIAFPSFGAITVYGLPSTIAARLPLSLNLDYARALLHLFAHGPGPISPTTGKGLVGFPSFHTAEAVIAIWYARRLGILLYVFLAFNVVVIISTPIQGGHHFVDTIGGGLVAAIAIYLSDAIARRIVRASQNERSLLLSRSPGRSSAYTL